MLKPPSVMESGPPPGIIRFPVPPRIGIDPLPTVEIRLPCRGSDGHTRLPAAAETLQVQPISVRGERVIKSRIIIVDLIRLSSRHIFGLIQPASGYRHKHRRGRLEDSRRI